MIVSNKTECKFFSFILTFIVTVFLLLIAPVDSHSAATTLATTQPDECFCGIGDVDSQVIPMSLSCNNLDITPDADNNNDGNPGPDGVNGPNCRIKRNQSYVWGLTKSGNFLWLGTAANVLCSVIGGLGDLDPFITNNFVTCEFGFSILGSNPPPLNGDHRPPHIYTFDITAPNSLVERSVAGCPGGPLLLETTAGLRSAGSVGNIVILAGPDLDEGVNMFAFNATTKTCIAAQHFPQYNDIRKWLTVNNVLYAALGNTGGGGSVLRFSGNLSNPLQSQIVGRLDNPGANIALHKGKIYVTTWPDIEGLAADAENINFLTLLTLPPAGIYVSPTVPSGGLTSFHARLWRKVWQYTEYETDRLSALIAGGGDLISFGGWLYWGTMHVPTSGFLAHAIIFEPDLLESCSAQYAGNEAAIQDCQDRKDLAEVNTFRSTAIFRSANLDALFGIGKKVELLYGETTLPTWPVLGNGGWTYPPNKMGKAPLYGTSGFGNPYNVYTWIMSVLGNKLYIGTFDSRIILDGGSCFPDNGTNKCGGDLWVFNNTTSAAQAVITNGFDNPLNYGFRTVISADALYLGTANPFNIAGSAGGWKLIKFTP